MEDTNQILAGLISVVFAGCVLGQWRAGRCRRCLGLVVELARQVFEKSFDLVLFDQLLQTIVFDRIRLEANF